MNNGDEKGLSGDDWPEDTDAIEPNPNFRLLLSHSKYGQIERELLKMFEQRHYYCWTKNKKSCQDQNYCSHNHNHSLERLLFDIEEDLHKILLLLVKQLEMFSESYVCARNLKIRKNEEHELQPNGKNLINEPLNLATNITKQHSSVDFKKQNKTLIQDPNKNNRRESEYSQLCLQSDERFWKKFYRIQQSHATSNLGTSHSHSHYRLTKPDIDFILGSPSNANLWQSHSRLASKQLQLAELKQHNSLCTKIGDLQRRKSSQQQSQQIIKQIQCLIDELHMEHDWISKKLHYYQKRNQVILNENRTLADKMNLYNMYTLSEHLIHIMDHLYELHQLNKRHLKLILG